MTSADETLERTRRNFILALMAGLGVLSFFIFEPFFSYAILGLLLAYLVAPVQARFERWTRLPRISAFFVMILVAAVVVVPLAWMAAGVAEAVSDFARSLRADAVEATLDSIVASLYALAGRPPPATAGTGRELLLALVPRAQSYFAGLIPELIAGVAHFAVGLVVLAFVFFYALVQRKALVAWLESLSPLDRRLNRELKSEISRTLDAVFFGHLTISLLHGVATGVGLAVFGVPHAAFWGAVCVVLALLPLLGTPLVWVPAALWLYATGHPGAALGLTIWNVVLVGVEHFIRPVIVGLKADIHPVIVIVGVLGGLALFGFVGFVVGPLVLSLLVAVLNFWRQDFLPAYEAEHGG